MRTFGPTLSQQKDSRPSPDGPTAGEPGSARTASTEILRIAGDSDFSQVSVTSAPRAGLLLGAVGDEREREADQAASRAVREPAPMPAGAAGEQPAQAVPPIVRDAVRGSGQPLDPGTRAALESSFGRDLSQVRVHADHLAAQSAAAIGAEAFTAGQHIVFGLGRYDPQTPAGRRLLAHEIAHRLQPDAAVTVRRHPTTAPAKRGQPSWKEFNITIPPDVATTQQFLRYIEVRIFGHVTNTAWDLSAAPSVRDAAHHAGEQVAVRVTAADLEAKGADEASVAAINAEADRRYYEATHTKPGTKIGPREADRAAVWKNLRAQILADRAALARLPEAVKNLLGPENFAPEHYAALRQLGDTLSQLTDAELHSFFQITPHARAITPDDYARLLAVTSQLVALSPAARQDYLSRVGGLTSSLSDMAAALDRYSQLRETRQAQAVAHDAAAEPLLNSNDVYTAYRDYIELRHFAEMDETGYLWRQVAEAETELVAKLQPRGFASVAAFEEAIERYRLAFRTQAATLALDVLDRYEHMLFTERGRLAAGAAGPIAQGIAKSGAAGYFAEASRQEDTATLLFLGGDEYDSTTVDLGMEAKAAAAAARQQGEEAVRQGSGKDPLVSARGTDLEKLAGLDEAGTKAYLLQLIDKHTEEITTARREFADDPERVFSQGELVTATETMLGIDPATVYGRIIADHIADEKSKHLFSQVVLGILALAVLFVVPVGGWVAAAALVGQAGLSVYQAYTAQQEYQKNKRDWDLGFIADEPLLVWVGVAIAGAVLDLGPAAGAVVKESALALRALKAPLVEFSEGGELAPLLAKIETASGLDARIQRALAREARAADQARQAWRGALAATGRTNMVIGLLDPALARDLARALYYSIKRGVTSIVRLSAEARFLNIAGDLAKLTEAERAELQTAFEEVRQLVAAGQAKGMDDEALLAFVDRWVVNRRKPGFLAKLSDEMQTWKPLTAEQRQARSALAAQKTRVAGLYERKDAALEELRELQAEGRRVGRTAENDAEIRKLQRELNWLDPQALADPARGPRAEVVKDFGKGEIHGAEVTLEAVEQDAARADLTLYDRLRAVAPSDRVSDRVLAGMTADPLGLITAPSGLSVDHIVPIREIADIDGFADLLWKDQKEIVDLRANLMPMDRVANSSKSDWPWRLWPQASRFYGEDAIEQMIKREDTVRGLIRDEIDRRLAALRVGARP